MILRYEDKRWVARDGKLKSPSRGQEEKATMHWLRQAERIGHGYTSSSENSFHERKNIQPPTRKDAVLARRISIPVPPKGPEQLSYNIFMHTYACARIHTILLNLFSMAFLFDLCLCLIDFVIILWNLIYNDCVCA